MATLTEIEAAAAKLPPDEQRNLLDRLAARVGKLASAPSSRQSILDIAPVSLGGILDRAGADDDIPGEMLGGRI